MLNTQKERCLKSINFYQRAKCISVSQRVSHARQDHGPPGPPGPRGHKGARGRRGQKGKTGNKGDQGIMGSPGKSGKQGIMGPVGLQGETGDKGEKGDIGPADMPGTKGEPGESISSPAVVVSPVTLTVNEGTEFNKTIIPFALVGYEMVIANSYPTRAHGIIAK